MTQAIALLALYAQLSEKALLFARALLGGTKQRSIWQAQVEFVQTPKKIREVRRGLEAKLDQRRFVSCHKRICAGYLDPGIAQGCIIFIFEAMHPIANTLKCTVISDPQRPRTQEKCPT